MLSESISKVPPIIVISGATATGKSNLALKLAKTFNGVILNGDSRQVYKELQIGTDKPTFDAPQDKHTIDGITHYLYDYVSIFEKYNLHIYQQDAFKTLKEINSTTPCFLVGGTGLYIDSVVFNYNFEDGKGQKFTNLYLNLEGEGQQYEARIRARVEEMFKKGLEQEASRFKEYILAGNIRALKTIGYQEFVPYFQGESSIEQVKERIFLHTRQYAKRQRTWFRRNEGLVKITSYDQAEAAVKNFLI